MRLLTKVMQRTSSLYHAKLQDERQLAWDQREVELERQLDQYEKHQNEIVNGADKVRYLFTAVHYGLSYIDSK